MKYIIELDSPDMDRLVHAAESHTTAWASIHRVNQRTLGRGHARTLAAAAMLHGAERALEAVKKAVRDATPEHATPTHGEKYYAVTMSDPDDARQATSRPMRVKASNLRRRSQL